MEIINLNSKDRPDEIDDALDEAKEEVIRNTTSTLVKQPDEKKTAVETFTESAAKKVEESLKNGATPKDFQEGGKAIAHVMMTAAAMNGQNEENQEFLRDIKEEKQKELKQSFLSERFKEEAKKYAAKQQKAEAFYTNVRPILEFDFSPLIPKNAKTKLFKKKVKRDKKGNVISEPIQEIPTVLEEDYKPTYQDRSYGIGLMVLMLFLLTIPYCLITVILAVGNGINAIFNGIARFGKPALVICGTIVGMAISILAIYCACKGVDALFGTNILRIFSKN